ncbi:MAG: hypothetical protein U1E14_15825 [Geminicoccaceae bacterium]
MSSSSTPVQGMSPATARFVERCIIWLCILSLVFIFQPFNKLLSGVGMALVVFGGLAFNLVPLCEPGRPARDLVRAAITVVVIFLIVFGLAVLSAWGYGEYLRATR